MSERDPVICAAMHRFEMEPALLVVREILPQVHAEKVLLAAIIRRAAYDLALYKGDRRTDHKNLYIQAREWIFDDTDQLDRSEQFMSFRNLCWMLNESPERLRQKILKLKKRDVRQYDMFDGHPRV
jgi:hypothetical protein